MALNQTWDKDGNLIESVEVPDIDREPTAEEVLADLIQVLVDKGVIY